jgi:hypothetical protein
MTFSIDIISLREIGKMEGAFSININPLRVGYSNGMKFFLKKSFISTNIRPVSIGTEYGWK